tara:strand:+ start:84 stop:302 length:219 start_codon:yes stop_codon:yes gene_type:complete
MHNFLLLIYTCQKINEDIRGYITLREKKQGSVNLKKKQENKKKIKRFVGKLPIKEEEEKPQIKEVVQRKRQL